MTNTVSKTCLSLALLVGSSAAFAMANAAVFQNGPAFIADSESLPSGYASAELAGGGTDGAGSYSYVGTAYADTRRGSLGDAAIASGTGYLDANDRLTVHAQSEFADALTFSDSGLITFRLAVQGSFATASGGQMSSFASLTIPGMTNRARTFWRGGSDIFTINAPGATVISALPSNYIVWLEGAFEVPAGIPIPVSAHLDVFITPPVDGTAQALFNHTAKLFLFMPDGVRFTSESGDFLVDAVSPVPEPAIAWMLAGGLLAGSVARRRAAAARRLVASRARGSAYIPLKSPA